MCITHNTRFVQKSTRVGLIPQQKQCIQNVSVFLNIYSLQIQSKRLQYIINKNFRSFSRPKFNLVLKSFRLKVFKVCSFIFHFISRINFISYIRSNYLKNKHNDKHTLKLRNNCSSLFTERKEQRTIKFVFHLLEQYSYSVYKHCNEL